MQTKKCFKCGLEKPLTDFYPHKKMKDGYLNKCKACTKEDSIKTYQRKSQDENWIESERKRGREKFKRLGYRNKFIQTHSKCGIDARNISRALRAAGYATTGKEAHHWNYNHPGSVILLSKKAHKLIHKYINVNYEDRFCYDLKGHKLKTIEDTKALINYIFEENNINESYEVVNVSIEISKTDVKQLVNLLNRSAAVIDKYAEKPWESDVVRRMKIHSKKLQKKLENVLRRETKGHTDQRKDR